MSYNKYAGFFAAYNASVKRGNPLSKEEVIQGFTGGATSSLKELTLPQLQEIVRQLNATNADKFNTKEDKMRKAIIAIFKKMNRPTTAAIEWAEKQGVKGEKKKFNEYTAQELFVLIHVAEKVLADWQIAIRKKILNAI